MFALKRAADARIRTLPTGRQVFVHIDWFLVASALAISIAGLVTMRSFSVENFFFERQIVWICIGVAVFLLASIPEYGFLRRTPVLTGFFVITVVLLGLIYLFGSVVMGAQNRFSLGFFAVQPSDPANLLLIMILSKYFARRHIEIAHIRHIFVSGAYAFTLFILVFFQPDFGSSIIIASIWLGMVLAAGISWKQQRRQNCTRSLSQGLQRFLPCSKLPYQWRLSLRLSPHLVKKA